MSCWLCWHSWSPPLPHASADQVCVTGPPSSRRSSSCRHWPPSPPLLRSCWTNTRLVKETHACCSCWTGASAKVRKEKSTGSCIWKVKGHNHKWKNHKSLLTHCTMLRDTYEIVPQRSHYRHFPSLLCWHFNCFHLLYINWYFNCYQIYFNWQFNCFHPLYWQYYCFNLLTAQLTVQLFWSLKTQLKV